MLNIINRLFQFNWFPLVLQIISFGVFILLIAGGFVANTEDMVFAKVLRNTNLANLIVWSYWWPLIILSSIFLGRVWCTVCPMELVTSLAAKVGLKQKPPAFLRSGWVITAFYVLILFVGIHTLAIHRVPFRMALYMATLFSVAIVSGLLFSRNAFCAYICPIGHLLGVYARLAPMSWGVKDKSVCSGCKDKSCVSNRIAYKFQGRSCGVGLYPTHIDDNSDCLLCGQCLKACDRNNPGIVGRPNPGWFPRRWFKDMLELKPFTAAQAAFVLIVSGFVVYEVFTEWTVTKQLLLWLPTRLEQELGVSGAWSHGLIKSLTLFVVFPACVWLFPYGAFRLVGGRLRLSDYLLRFGIAFIPIMASAHATKALLKMTSRIPYWKYTVSDPIGAETARGILDKTTQLAPLPVWRDPMITLFSLVFMSVAILLSLSIVRKLITEHVSDSGWRSVLLYLIPGVFGGAFFVMLIAWRVL
ncbi:MAG: hypothetical protein B6244_09945 [Candidatus Cloacimonetes bacterium 4572_55]|nr:MAG: hypothetical protein B6244_09945 [Candidatus Cloacimonetes bacterium 4572_55]